MEDHTDYSDDPNISDHAALLRRVHPDWVIQDENLGGYRPSSAAFQDSSDTPMSVYVEDLVTAAQRTPGDLLRSYADHSLCGFTAGVARQLGQRVATLPSVPEEPAHGWVVGKKTGSVRRALKNASYWVILNPPSRLV